MSEDHSIMAELARLWDEDHGAVHEDHDPVHVPPGVGASQQPPLAHHPALAGLPKGTAAGAGAAARMQHQAHNKNRGNQGSAGGGWWRPGRVEATATAGSDGVLDPFLLPGDEQTWEASEWALHPAQLTALHRNQLLARLPQQEQQQQQACCQALKRHRPDPEQPHHAQRTQHAQQQEGLLGTSAVLAAAAAAASFPHSQQLPQHYMSAQQQLQQQAYGAPPLLPAFAPQPPSLGPLFPPAGPGTDPQAMGPASSSMAAAAAAAAVAAAAAAAVAMQGGVGGEWMPADLSAWAHAMQPALAAMLSQQQVQQQQQQQQVVMQQGLEAAAAATSSCAPTPSAATFAAAPACMPCTGACFGNANNVLVAHHSQQQQQQPCHHGCCGSGPTDMCHVPGASPHHQHLHHQHLHHQHHHHHQRVASPAATAAVPEESFTGTSSGPRDARALPTSVTHAAVLAPATGLDCCAALPGTPAHLQEQGRPQLSMPPPLPPRSAAAAAVAAALPRSSLAGRRQRRHNDCAGEEAEHDQDNGSASDAGDTGDAAPSAIASMTQALAASGPAGGGSRRCAQSGSGAATRRAAAPLPVATYTGRLEDVVALSDVPCSDEGQRLCCQVAGCAKDLSGTKEYHQRYRVCDVHIKLPQVLKDGRLQRFCQQCGRFHDLAAFDVGRKSCREQLEKHNARRRRRAQIEAQKHKQAQERPTGPAALISALTSSLALTTTTTTTSSMAGALAVATASPATAAPSALTLPQGALDAATAAAAAATATATASDMGVAAGEVGAAGVGVGAGGSGSGALLPGGSLSDVGRLLTALTQNPAHLQALKLLLGVQTHPALPPLQPFTPEPLAPATASALLAGVPGRGEPATYTLAREVADGRGAWVPGFESDHRALRISLKLFNRTPADLPANLREQVTSWLTSMPAALVGAMRPGCVMLTLHLLLDQGAHHQALRRGLRSLLHHLRHETGCLFWHHGAYVAQLGREMALVVDGHVTNYHLQPQPLPPPPTPQQHVQHTGNGDGVGMPWACACPGPTAPCEVEVPALPGGQGGLAGHVGPTAYPLVSQLVPCCVAAPPPRPRPGGDPATGSPAVLRVALRGAHLGAGNEVVVVRQQGLQLRLPLLPMLDDHGDGGGNSENSGDAVGRVGCQLLPHKQLQGCNEKLSGEGRDGTVPAVEETYVDVPFAWAAEAAGPRVGSAARVGEKVGGKRQRGDSAASSAAAAAAVAATSKGGSGEAAAQGPAVALSRCGVAWLEVSRGAWLSPCRPLLVVDDAQLAAEVCQLQDAGRCRARLSQDELDALLVDLGMVLSHANPDSGLMVDCFAPSGDNEPTAATSSGNPSACLHPPHVALKARRLLLLACDMGWAAVAARVLPLATGACACAAELVDAVHASCGSAFPTLAPTLALHAGSSMRPTLARPAGTITQPLQAGLGAGLVAAGPVQQQQRAGGSTGAAHGGCCGCCSGGRHCGRAGCRCAERCAGGDGPTSVLHATPAAVVAAEALRMSAPVGAAAVAAVGGCCTSKPGGGGGSIAPAPQLSRSSCSVMEATEAEVAVPAAPGGGGGGALVGGGCGTVGGGGGGLSLLHRVVRSGSLALLQGVLHWGAVAGYAWRADRNGPGGITPLHLAALQEDPRILMALLDYAPPNAFTTLQAHDGTTPFHLAFQMGHFSLDAHVLPVLLRHQGLLPSDELSARLATAATANTSSLRQGPTPSGRLRSKSSSACSGSAGAHGGPEAAAAVAVRGQHLDEDGAQQEEVPGPQRQGGHPKPAGGVELVARAAGQEGSGAWQLEVEPLPLCVVSAAQARGRQVDPCAQCHTTLPPLVLSIAAACAQCGSRVPCLGRLAAHRPAPAPKQPGAAAAASAPRGAGLPAGLPEAPGHDAAHCAGCGAEQQLRGPGQGRGAAGGVRALLLSLSQAATELAQGILRGSWAAPAPAWRLRGGDRLACGWHVAGDMQVDCNDDDEDEANNNYYCYGSTMLAMGRKRRAVPAAEDVEDVAGEEEERGEGEQAAWSCWHQHGSVFSVTALCQGCHANRVLEVM